MEFGCAEPLEEPDCDLTILLSLRRAVQETARDTKLDTGAGAMMVLVGTVLASGVLWVLLGYALPDSSLWARVVVAAVPLLWLPIALGMRLAAVPPALHGEAARRIAELEKQIADLALQLRSRWTRNFEPVLVGREA